MTLTYQVNKKMSYRGPSSFFLITSGKECSTRNSLKAPQQSKSMRIWETVRYPQLRSKCNLCLTLGMWVLLKVPLTTWEDVLIRSLMMILVFS